VRVLNIFPLDYVMFKIEVKIAPLQICVAS
jgi:hypothetical protein